MDRVEFFAVAKAAETSHFMMKIASGLSIRRVIRSVECFELRRRAMIQQETKQTNGPATTDTTPSEKQDVGNWYETETEQGTFADTNPCIFLMTPIAFPILLVYSAFYENRWSHNWSKEGRRNPLRSG